MSNVNRRLACNLLLDPVHRHTRDAERPRDCGGTDAAFQKFPDFTAAYAWFPACVDSGFFGFCNSFGLAVPADVRLELRKNSQHSKEGPACRCGCVDTLLDDAQMSADGVDLVGDVGEVAK